jgi:hypothetical protein
MKRREDTDRKWGATVVFGGLLFSAAIRIFFRFHPAREAANLGPIEALHFE